jgi:hypothetical protein
VKELTVGRSPAEFVLGLNHVVTTFSKHPLEDVSEMLV